MSSSSANRKRFSFLLSTFYLPNDLLQWVLLTSSQLHTTVQDRGSLKGLLPVGTPTSRASLPAFCRQYCWSSAAACDTWEHQQGLTFTDSAEQRKTLKCLHLLIVFQNEISVFWLPVCFFCTTIKRSYMYIYLFAGKMQHHCDEHG